MAGSTLLLATTNPGKRAEFARLLPPDIELLTLADVGAPPPEETGSTFREIAAGKALVAAASAGLLALADDSGLEVDALDGAPGVRTARYAGDSATDAENRAKLLADLRGEPPPRRTARFRCAVALARPGQLLAAAEGTCEGAIAAEERGGHGFGYDPVFLLPDGRTMAELRPSEKDRLSHRGRAMAALRPRLEEVIASNNGDPR